MDDLQLLQKWYEELPEGPKRKAVLKALVNLEIKQISYLEKILAVDASAETILHYGSRPCCRLKDKE